MRLLIPFALVVSIALVEDARRRAVIHRGTALTHLAGSSASSPGHSDGAGYSASFSSPRGITVDPVAGSIYIADTANHTIRRIAANGDVTTLAGMAEQGGFADGDGAAARFRLPHGLAIDSAGLLYVADTGNHAIRRVDPNGGVSTLETPPLRFPSGVAVDADGALYVADSGNAAILRITEGTTSTLADARSGIRDPVGVAIGDDGVIYVSDRANHCIYRIAGGVVSLVAGAAGEAGMTDGATSTARFSRPAGLIVDSTGALLVADSCNHAIRQIAGGVVTTVAGGDAANFRFVYALARQSKRNVLIADSRHHAIRVLFHP